MPFDSLASWEDTGHSLDLWVRPGAFPRVEHMKGASFGQPLALLTNIRLVERLAWTNTLNYYEHDQITAVKHWPS